MKALGTYKNVRYSLSLKVSYILGKSDWNFTLLYNYARTKLLTYLTTSLSNTDVVT